MNYVKNSQSHIAHRKVEKLRQRTAPRHYPVFQSSRAVAMLYGAGILQAGKRKIQKWFRNLDADGFIVHTWDQHLIDSIVNLGIPAIIHGPLYKPRRRVYPLLTDEFGTGRMAAEYFMKRGFKNFAYCGFDMIWSIQKGDGFKQTLAEAGFQTSIYRQPRAKHLRKPPKEQPLQGRLTLL